jgi:branched-chain amino acid transport system ATP-binding protein
VVVLGDDEFPVGEQQVRHPERERPGHHEVDVDVDVDCGLRDEYAGNLSGGQRKLLELGRALMVDPDLLILDEPSAGLAPQLVDVMFEEIAEINDDGTSALMVERNARRALAESDRGIVLDMGEDRLEGTGAELLDSEEVAELYLGT